ncbi:hypothetical protein GLOIN_2v1533061 [Rhizophagus clarus]|uniref:Uncharacterized protein n=1 Tax=Rhizophagus clarus TaxID=94130 RepID=A0A8H3QY15_9GLOM|nr:hypothetical protein GLOIN_2v1533061 [Rhizophagus clarus]
MSHNANIDNEVDIVVSIFRTLVTIFYRFGNEAVRCEYVSTILYAAIYIAKRIIKKGVSVAFDDEFDPMPRTSTSSRTPERIYYCSKSNYHIALLKILWKIMENFAVY